MPPAQLATAPVEVDVRDLTVDDLWFAFQATGSREDRDRLVLHYTGLVTYVVSRLGAPMPRSVDYADLIQSGVIGLMDAIGRFEPERGLKFETYAVTRIRGAILDELRAQDWVPRSVRKLARDLDTAAERTQARLARTPSAAELAEELDVTTVDLGIMRALTSRTRVDTLDAGAPCVAEGEAPCLAEALSDPFAELPGDALLAQASREMLWAALGSLSERDRLILVRSYMDGLTLAQIGRLLGVTESRVSQLRTKALRAMAAELAPHLAG